MKTTIETIGDATLYLGDCMDILPILDKVDAVITDPPYGIGADKNLRANKKHGNAAAPSKDYGNANWDEKPPSNELIDLVIKSGNLAILWGGNYFGLPASQCWLVWDKENGNNGYADCELAWTNMDKAVRRIKWRWAGMLQQDMQNKEDRVHPTQKPIQVMSWCLEQAGSPKIILDPFMGSGTTGVAAIQMGRKFIGIEREPKYFDIACKRIEQASKQVDMFIQPAKQIQDSLIP